jgi:hypothetical protein
MQRHVNNLQLSVVQQIELRTKDVFCGPYGAYRTSICYSLDETERLVQK